MSLFGDSPNVARVIVDGHEVFQDFNLGAEEVFEVITDSGRSYRVRNTSMAKTWYKSWDVEELTAEGGSVPVGSVRKDALSQAHQFTRAGALMPAGSQGNLWNAVQSLLR